ncbi:hypothetical protein HHI36_014581 [Cryptolaemus montrouzieri]|uniref:YqaJ viral recombinase domain-containing protein n=1 Tax=Cryptolaemus montrouzieri TaxID=559131 RepID=A0ABD2N3N6_9CUCU
MLAGSPDGLCQDSIVEIKCPISNKKKWKTQQEMLFPNTNANVPKWTKKCYFCVADPNFSINKNVEIICINFDGEYVTSFLESIITFWKSHVYPLLYESIE